MDELLKAIEELKRAYKASGVGSVKIELDGGDTKCVEIDGVGERKITNRQWLESLSDEELLRYLPENTICDLLIPGCCHGGNCYVCQINWLRAEHKEVKK